MSSNFSYLCRAFPYVCSEFLALPIEPKGVLSFLSLLPFLCFTLPFSIFCFRASAFLGHCHTIFDFLQSLFAVLLCFWQRSVRCIDFVLFAVLFQASLLRGSVHIKIFAPIWVISLLRELVHVEVAFPNAQSLLKILLPSTKQASKAQILQTAKKVTIEELAFLDPNLYKNLSSSLTHTWYSACLNSAKQMHKDRTIGQLICQKHDETNEMNALIIDDRGKAFSRTLHMQYSLTWFLFSLYLSSAAWMTRGSTKGCIWLPLLRRFDQGHIQFLLKDKIMLVIVKKGLFPKSKKYFHHVLKPQKDYAVAS
ncbi:unnamed protein product [Malus baccata var. baccata]